MQIALSRPSTPSALITNDPNRPVDGRHIKTDEKKCLISNFKDVQNKIPAVIITAFPEDEPQNYAKDFLGVFLRMGYATGILVGGSKHYGDFGLMIGVKDLEHPSDTAKQFKDLIEKCYPNIRTIKFDVPTNLLPQFSNIDFDLFIGSKD